MSFLTPLFLLGLAGLAIPVIIHLIQRERKHVVEFPSLMFLRRIPYQSVRRRRVRHWPLLLLRLAALALIVLAFARPFFRRGEIAAAASGGAREAVVLIDRSYSMAYGDRWQRALDAARNAVDALGSADRASIVFFGTATEVAVRSTADRGRLLAALSTAKTGPGATRYGPALKLAGSILSESPLPKKDVILVSDFQRSGWQGTDGVRLPDGATVTPVMITGGETPNVAVTPVSLNRTAFSGQERVAVTAGVMNRGTNPVSALDVTLEVGGRPQQTQRVNIDPNGSASVTFAAFTPETRDTRATVRIADDALPNDNAFNFVVSPRRPVKLLIAERPGASGASLYLSRALSLSDTPALDVAVKNADALSDDDLASAAVVVLNDVTVPSSLGERLARFVERGGGLLVVAGGRAAWQGDAAVLPAQLGSAVDRTTGSAARLGALDYSHSVFEPFRAPRSGDFSIARFYGYRTVSPVKTATTVARFDDGAPALVERRVGNGRALVWASSVDLQWNDLALKPVFLPFVHRMARYLSAYEERPSWMTVGDVLEAARGTGAAASERVVLTPSGQRVALDDEGVDVLTVEEQGFYEIRGHGRDGDGPMTVASNVDLGESDLTPMDPQELVAAATGHAGGDASEAQAAAPTDQARESAQKVWWHLLFAGLVLLSAETVLASRFSLRG